MNHCKCCGGLGCEVCNYGDGFTPAEQPVPASTGRDALSYGPVHVVADLVRNLLTLDQSAPIYSAFHVDHQGQRRCRTRGVMTSWERVIDGKWVDPARTDVPYAVIVWAKPEQDEAAPVAARELDVEAERREFEADEIAHQQARHPQEPLTAEQKAYLLRRDPQQRDSYAACGGEWEGWLRRAARNAAQGTQPESAPVSTEQAGDAWISVEVERKPPGRTPILVAVSFVRFGEYEDGTPGEFPGQIVAEGEYVPQHGEAGGYFTCYSSPHGDLEGITHWMPLPVAPSPNNSPVGADRRE